MDLLEIFLAISFFLIGIVASTSYFVSRSRDMKDYPEIYSVSLFLAVSAIVFFALSGFTVYLGLSYK